MPLYRDVKKSANEYVWDFDWRRSVFSVGGVVLSYGAVLTISQMVKGSRKGGKRYIKYFEKGDRSRYLTALRDFPCFAVGHYMRF